ncbi:MAG: radical SAM protein [Eubacterium sp.]|nr:radical SAM protein [Eubacterium sp.]
MSEEFDMQAYMARAVERVVKESIRATLKDPKESAFIMKFAAATRQAAKKRAKSEKEGEHIPTFLIASITSSCNLHCEGCYSRHTHATNDQKAVSQLTDEEWLRIFKEADELGLSFIILAGGEPLMRRDVIEAAAKVKNILFPIFTNGVYMDEEYFKLFDKYRHLIPIMSIEGNKKCTDDRRGEGIYEKVISNMDRFHAKGLPFGASVTATTENLEDIVSEEFLDSLSERGCKVVFYVEFTDVNRNAAHLAPGDEEREFLRKRLEELRATRDDLVFIAFPGDEKSSGGCIAAGRAFFHINSHGDAEPCPVSPYSDINVKDTSLKEAIHSKLFKRLIAEEVLNDEHDGGCVLFEKDELVKEIVRAQN